MTSVAQELPSLRLPGIASALNTLTGGAASSMKAERDARLFRQQLLRALKDPEVAAALHEAAAGAHELDRLELDALDFDGNPDSAKEEDGAAQATPAAADAATPRLSPPSAVVASGGSTNAKSAAKKAAWQASAVARMRQSGKTIDAINADAVTEIVNSHYTMTAWLLCPSHDALSHRMGKTIQYCVIGMVASITQCLIVNALIADLIDKERWGNKADGLLEEVQGLRTGSSIIGREMQYCRNEQGWKEQVHRQSSICLWSA